MSTGPQIQTHRNGNPQHHNDGRRVPQRIIGDQRETGAVDYDQESTTLCLKYAINIKGKRCGAQGQSQSGLERGIYWTQYIDYILDKG